MRIEGKGRGFLNYGGGWIELTDDGVLIEKKNMNGGGASLLGIAIDAATATKGGFTVPYESIHSVNISEGGWTTPPYIQILTPGDRPVSDVEVAIGLPSCLLFKKDSMSTFRELKAEVERRVGEARKKSNAPPAPAVSLADEIKKFGELLSAGLITQEEFDRKKAQLLG